MSQAKRTPLYQLHLELGAKMAEYGGWLMPIEYAGIIADHQAVRSRAGLFDVSHMGEIRISGPDAAGLLDGIMTNNIAGLSPGRIRYTLMCDQTGGVVDDLLVYRFTAGEYMLIVNAANKDKDLDWIMRQRSAPGGEREEQANAEVRDISGETGLLALQGPLAQEILAALAGGVPIKELKSYHFIETAVAGLDCLISRTGYTGEDGFEIAVAAGAAPGLWTILMASGKSFGLAPAGLGARDTLRFEAALPLYGHELTGGTTPLEAGLERFIDWGKGEFIGRQALYKQKTAGITRKLAGFKMIGRGIPRSGYELYQDGILIGKVTSGSFAPTLKANLGLGYVVAGEAYVGNEITVDIRGKKVQAGVTEIPFYRRDY